MAHVEMNGVRYLYGRRAVLDGVSVSFTPGVCALVGANGSGKSTLLALLATLLRPSSGTVAFDGVDVRPGVRLRAARRQLGYLPQSPSFPGSYTAAEAVAYAAWLHRVPRPHRRDAIERALDVMQLNPHRDQRLSTLSGGTAQRVYIAQATVHRPSLLLLDEATVGVDAEQRVGLRELIRTLAVDRTVVLSTHLTEDIELLADRVVVLNAGRVGFDGTPTELVARHAGPATSTERPVESALRSIFTDEAVR